MSNFRTFGKVLEAVSWQTDDFHFQLRVEENCLGFSAYLYARRRDVLKPSVSQLPLVGVGKTASAAITSLMRNNVWEVKENHTILLRSLAKFTPLKLVS